jgi:HD-GYP domain-containing protein (c-di-GMP phosphodiesterase class II)
MTLSAQQELVPIRTRALYPPVASDVAIYLPARRDAQSRLYCSSGQHPTCGDLDRLIERGITTVYVPADDSQRLRTHLREIATGNLEMPPEVRLEVAREAMKVDLAKAWQQDRPDELVSLANDFSQRVVDVCSSKAEISSVLASLVVHDSDTFTHVSNVCAYAVMLAREATISSEQELLRIGLAAMLHDLGKRSVCVDILNKPGPLTSEQREIIADHPRIGFQELAMRSDLTRDQLLMVYQHHEKLNGTGYPVQLVGSEINWMAQLCAVVDVFDALTARRRYREPASIEQALEIILGDIDSHFSAEFATCWATCIRRTNSTCH